MDIFVYTAPIYINFPLHQHNIIWCWYSDLCNLNPINQEHAVNRLSFHSSHSGPYRNFSCFDFARHCLNSQRFVIPPPRPQNLKYWLEASWETCVHHSRNWKTLNYMQMAWMAGKQESSGGQDKPRSWDREKQRLDEHILAEISLTVSGGNWFSGDTFQNHFYRLIITDTWSGYYREHQHLKTNEGMIFFPLLNCH